MTKISGIFAATMSILNNDLSLNIEKTINLINKPKNAPGYLKLIWAKNQLDCLEFE